MTRARCGLFTVVVLLVAIAGAGRANQDGPYWAPEPWAGWWWPQYCTGDSSCPYCPYHLWAGADTGWYKGPIHDLDTKYFWRSGNQRTQAQNWEYAHHRTIGSSNDGHCDGLAFVSVVEQEPPGDCGALSRFDLKGLLTELYYGDSIHVTNLTPFVPARPADLWLACRAALHPYDTFVTPPKAFAADFDTGPGRNWYAVYGYEVTYVVNGGVWAMGWITLHREGRYEEGETLSGAIHRPETRTFHFDSVQMRGDAPRQNTGRWSGEAGPEEAILPLSRYLGDPDVNPYLDTNDIRRVIEHKTIILDDPYVIDTFACPPYPPPGTEWLRRPGYADSCWGCLNDAWHDWYWVIWTPRLGCSGEWSIYAYKTPPYQGEQLDTCAGVYVYFVAPLSPENGITTSRNRRTTPGNSLVPATLPLTPRGGSPSGTSPGTQGRVTPTSMLSDLNTSEGAVTAEPVRLPSRSAMKFRVSV
jgi:hypothetical protein